MKRVFADTLYWIASLMPGDPWHAATVRAVAALGEYHRIVTEDVFVEFLTAYSGRGRFFRQQAARVVRAALQNPSVTLLPQSHSSFIEALDLYESRPDKSYSLTDCISMSAMRTVGITDILTNDHHFTQEGFNILIRK